MKNSTSHSSKLNSILTKELDPAFRRRAKFIADNLDIQEKMKVLDAGCGRGFYVKLLNHLYSNIEIQGVDIEPTYLDEIHGLNDNSNKVDISKQSLSNLEFPDNYFDRIILSEVLEHVPDQKAVLDELKRILKPGGSIFITVPGKEYPFFWDPINFVLEKLFNKHVPKHIWWLAGIWADHNRLYTPEYLTDTINKSGLNVDIIEKSTSYSLPFMHFMLYGIGKNLVTSRLAKGDFDRFNIDSKQSILNKVINFPIKLADRFNEGKVDGKRYVNLLTKVSK